MHADSRQCVLLLGSILETPNLADRLLEVLRPHIRERSAIASVEDRPASPTASSAAAFRTLSNAAKHLRQPVADYFRTNIHITTSGYFTRPPFDCCREVVGLDRMMFSVGYPFSPNGKGRDFLSAPNLSEADLATLTHGNAERLLKL